ncbi:MAG: tRNA (adenosine(37)-N6)-threonylcarbamoyltransferase complex transferase subunit TsaD, partial [Elusimicrobiota bacterium]|nr:tRNA (adenosine(37)-N6)-threonylcarbamoyltransferase complex transferase subunit TsaD [Elusimicrobiota bacterium]
MAILGIETSCDETSVAVIESPRKVLFHIVASQEKLHRKYFGVVPELASREHLTNLRILIEKVQRLVLRQPHSTKRGVVQGLLNHIDAVAVTIGPGLAGSLLVGTTVAKTIAVMNNVPIVGVNHLEGHIFSAFIEDPKLKSSTSDNFQPNTSPTPPFIALIVSGGHTELVIVEDFGKYNVLGRTRDDAAGEAFDKVARLLSNQRKNPTRRSHFGLYYPGGPAIERLAKSGNPEAIKFPRPYMWDSWDFSFSGLKTA